MAKYFIDPNKEVSVVENLLLPFPHCRSWICVICKTTIDTNDLKTLQNHQMKKHGKNLSSSQFRDSLHKTTNFPNIWTEAIAEFIPQTKTWSYQTVETKTCTTCGLTTMNPKKDHQHQTFVSSYSLELGYGKYLLYKFPSSFQLQKLIYDEKLLQAQRTQYQNSKLTDEQLREFSDWMKRSNVIKSRFGKASGFLNLFKSDKNEFESEVADRVIHLITSYEHPVSVSISTLSCNWITNSTK